MNINFKSTNYSLSPNIEEFTTKKIRTLKKYLGKDTTYEQAQVFVTLGKETTAHQSGKIWGAEINFDFEGMRFHAKSIEENLEEAIVGATREIAGELNKAGKKRLSMMRRGGKLVKSLLRGFRD
jgi:ribosomal subunit interface protein